MGHPWEWFFGFYGRLAKFDTNEIINENLKKSIETAKKLTKPREQKRD